MRCVTVVSAAVAGLVLVGCSSSGGGPTTPTSAASSAPAPAVTTTAPVPTASSPAPSSSAPSSSAPASSAAAVSPSGSASDADNGGKPITQAEAQLALLTAAEVGTGFTQSAGVSSNTPLPCAAANSIPLATQVPPAADASSEYTLSTTAALHEEIYSFTSVAQASKAYQIGVAGFSCSTGSIYSTAGATTSVIVSNPQDVASVLDVSAGMSWDIQTSQLSGGVFLVRYGARMIELTFLAMTAADTSSLPDTETVVETAVAKAAAVG